VPVTFDIVHTTHYRYHQPVELGLHRVMFRPRGSHDLHVLATDLQVTPAPLSIRMIMDVYSNSIALLEPQSPADELKIVSTFTVESSDTPLLELPLDPQAEHYPFSYAEEDRIALPHYLAPYYDDPGGELEAWARQFVLSDGPTGTRDLLLAMTQSIRDAIQYVVRLDEGVQTPLDTLRLKSGSCRDLATLMIEAVRRLGYAARFVSGYLYAPWRDRADPGLVGAGATHAWLQVYLPGPGWIAFDPTNNLIGGRELIRVGVARHASLAPPVSGSWHGVGSDAAGMAVDVQVTRR